MPTKQGQSRTPAARRRALWLGRHPGPGRPRRWPRLLPPAFVLLVALAALYLPAWLASGRQTTDDAYVRGDITPIAAHTAGYLAAVPMEDNQPVKAGQLLALIEDSDYRQNLRTAQANLAQARATLDDALRAVDYQKAQVASARATIQSLQARLRNAAADLRRYREILAIGAVSRQQMDSAQANFQSLQAQGAQLEAQLQAARRLVDSKQAQVEKARAGLAQAQSQLTSRRIELGWTRITAPRDGVVGERQVRPGVYVQPGTLIAQLVPLPEVWVVANFKENQLTHIRPRQPASIRIDSLPGHIFSGHVDSLQPASGASFALLPPDNATGNFTKVVQRFPVKIRLDPGQNQDRRILPGMSVIASVDCQQNGTATPLPSRLWQWLMGRR